MTQADLIRKLATLTPNTPYATLLKDEFNVEVPESAPKYQQEYLYKYCLQLSASDTPADQLVTLAAKKAEDLMRRYPWAMKKYDELPTVKKAVKKAVSAVADGKIVYNESLKKFEGFLGGKVVSRASTAEKVAAWMAKKYNVVASL